ncbi:hypothetical protein jhhlp_004489 [Lomentospora prolificans]|uniref:Pyruvate kinase n=1 Tax=Lomentospora prolificans TaxID=41688 RepID=A0A2N3NBN7_9PEZI|nr:hypothetical protein jhhlp_004489 [Lomentospora prolificans]
MTYIASSLDYSTLDNVGKLSWLASLDPTFRSPKNFRRTGIIGTIGPKSNSVQTLSALRAAGLNVARLNFSHGDHAFHKSVIDNVRKLRHQEHGKHLAIALDTKGSEIRTGLTRDDTDVSISAGKELTVTTDEKYSKCCDSDYIYIDYKNIANAIQPGRTIFIDDGALAFEVLSVTDDKTLRVRAKNSGILSSRKGVNLPNTDVDLPSLSEKDKDDLRFGVEQNVDMIFASFIRRAADIHEIREVLGDRGTEIPIIAKIENRQGLNACEEIIAAADGVMVARGDLGIEIPLGEVFVAQKKIISLCNIAGKPVICATQMLESMIKNPRPTRAEISDVGNAITDGADCVMLSGETAKGDYPINAVREMHETCLIAENTIQYLLHFIEMCNLIKRPVSGEESSAMNAVRASLDVRAGAIIVLSATGETARLVSKYRPNCPIMMVTRNRPASRGSHLSRGIVPLIYPHPPRDDSDGQWQADIDLRIKWAIWEAQKINILDKSDPVIIVQGWKAGLGHTNIIRVLTPDAEAAVLESKCMHTLDERGDLGNSCLARK